jgi:hypothetical protein
MSTIAAGNTLTTGYVQSSDTTGNLVFQTNGTTTALTLTTGQNANFVGSVSAVNTFGFKNRIINGAMTIDQRNAGASVTPTADLTYTLDRYVARLSQSSKYSVQQNAGSVTPPVGYTSYLGVTSLSAYSVTSTDYFSIQQKIEGLNTADLAWGTANAKTITFSFQVYSSLTGTFGGSLTNSAANRCYPFTYTISSANTWTSISITIAGDTTGTWLTTNGTGVHVCFALGAGSTQQGTAGAWSSTFTTSATGATSVVGTSGATFYITGVQFEVGSQATSFDFRDYGRELILCQRYAASTFPIGTAWAQAAGAAGCVIVTSVGAGVGYGLQIPWRFPVNMRTTPSTITTYNPVSANANSRNFGASSDRSISALNFSQNSQSGIVYTSDTTGDTVGQAVGVHYSVSAEL